MSKSTKAILAVLVLGFLTAYYFLVYIPHRDKKAADNFIGEYEKYEKANSAFIVPLFASNLGGDGLGRKTPVDVLNDKVVEALNSTVFDDLFQGNSRHIIAREAIAANNKIIDEINKSDKPQTDCEEAILVLNTAAASLLKNPEMRECATEICDLALERHNNLVSYKQALLEKHKQISELMNTVDEYNGNINNLNSHIENNKNKIEKNNETLDKTNAGYGVQTSKIAITYARFKGLAGIQNKK